MNAWLIAHEQELRLGLFLAVFAAVALAEVSHPRRQLSVDKGTRWVNNLTLVALNTLLLRLVFPVAAAGAATLAESQGWGLFHVLNMPPIPAMILSVILLDLTIYLQHVLFHAVPLLWRLHRVHHTDLDYDVTTGARFHPIEIMLSMLVKYAAIFLIGAPVASVIVFEVLLNATAMFNHGNLRLPGKVDTPLRWFIVTPDMHRVHHSSEADETNSNFGFNLPWWDRFFGTYRDAPRLGHISMRVGLETMREPGDTQGILAMLLMPFKKGDTGQYAINRRNWK